MKLYGSYTSPFVRHCRIALLESDLPFTFVETDNVGSAKLSPLQKVPFLHYEENGNPHQLTDSSAILKYIREQSGSSFFDRAEKGVQDFNVFCATNTLIDTAINVFYLEKDGLTAAQSPYIARQQSRLQTGLTELEKLTLAASSPYSDSELRIACFLDWALFRQRISLECYPQLTGFMQGINDYAHFSATTPKG